MYLRIMNKSYLLIYKLCLRFSGKTVINTLKIHMHSHKTTKKNVGSGPSNIMARRFHSAHMLKKNVLSPNFVQKMSHYIIFFHVSQYLNQFLYYLFTSVEPLGYPFLVTNEITLKDTLFDILQK